MDVWSPAQRAGLLDPPLLLCGPRRPRRKKALGRHACGLHWGPSLGVPVKCALISWVQVQGPPPSSDRVAWFWQTPQPVARLEQEPSGTVVGHRPHLHLPPGSGRQCIPFISAWWSLTFSPTPVLLLVPQIRVQIPAPLLTSCVISDSFLNLSDFSFLLEMKLLTPPSESWLEAH